MDFCLYDPQVQAVAWNHYAPEVLLSGSFDQTVVLVNVLFHGLFHVFQSFVLHKDH